MFNPTLKTGVNFKDVITGKCYHGDLFSTEDGASLYIRGINRNAEGEMRTHENDYDIAGVCDNARDINGYGAFDITVESCTLEFLEFMYRWNSEWAGLNQGMLSSLVVEDVK